MINHQKLLAIARHLWVVPSVAAGLIYGMTLAPSVMTIDSGELAAVMSTAGIAHPTGYPLFTIAGWLWTRLPIPGTDIFAVNILAMFFCMGAVACFVRGAQFFTGKFRKILKTSDAAGKADDPRILIINLVSVTCAALFLAFSKTFWDAATSVEVYSLHILLISILNWFLLKAYFTKKYELRPWLFVALILALCFANHMSTIMILPLIAWLFFLKHGANKKSFLLIGKMLVLFIPVILVLYSYLPARAAAEPIFNWGNPVSWNSFTRHVSGWQFQVWVFESSKAFKGNFLGFWKSFLPEFGWIGIVPAAIGAWFLIRRTWKTGIGLLITFFFCLFWASAYNIKDLEPYFLLAYLITAIWIVFGMRFLLDRLAKGKILIPAVAVALILPVFPAVLNFNDADKSDTYVYEDYTVKSLEELPQSALLVGTRWDYHHSPAWYEQQVEGIRKDVALVDFELLRRSWYHGQLSRLWPDLYEGNETYRKLFLERLQPFENDELTDTVALEAAFDSLVWRMIFRNGLQREIYFASEFLLVDVLQNKMILAPPNGTQAVPMHFFFLLTMDTAYVPLTTDYPEIRWPEKWDRYSGSIRDWLAFVRIERAIYEKRFGYKDKAAIYVEMVRREHPDYKPLVEAHNNYSHPSFLD